MLATGGDHFASEHLDRAPSSGVEWSSGTSTRWSMSTKPGIRVLSMRRV